jgi:AraC-like DNA-binding protein
LDSLPAQRIAGIIEAIEAVGVQLRHLPPHKLGTTRQNLTPQFRRQAFIHPEASIRSELEGRAHASCHFTLDAVFIFAGQLSQRITNGSRLLPALLLTATIGNLRKRMITGRHAHRLNALITHFYRKSAANSPMDSAYQTLVRQTAPSTSLKRIAYQCGFNDGTQFTKAFRARFGLVRKDVAKFGAPLLTSATYNFSYAQHLSAQAKRAGLTNGQPMQLESLSLA